MRPGSRDDCQLGLMAVCALHSGVCVRIASWTLHRGAGALSISDAITHPRWNGVFTECLATHIHLKRLLICAAVRRVEQDAAAAAERKRKKLQQRLA